MSLPTTTATPSTASSSATTTTIACKKYSGRDEACECFVSLYVITLLTIILCSTPAITRILLFLQPNATTFAVNSSTLSILNISSTAITADWNLTLSSTNPNKKPMSYNHISALALKDTSLALSTSSIQAFSQSGFCHEMIEVNFSGMVVELMNFTGSCEVLSLTFVLRASAGYGGWTWPIKTDRIKVVCGFQVEFPFNVSSLEFGYSNCSVNGKWKKMAEKCSSIFWNYVYVSVIVVGVLALSL